MSATNAGLTGTLSAAFVPMQGLAFTPERYFEAFEANPVKGDIFVPLEDNGKIKVARVDEESCGHMEMAVSCLLSEGHAIRATAHKWDPALSTAIESTGGRWTIEDMYKGGGYVLKSALGKHLGFHNYRRTFGIGYSGRYASCYQNVYLDNNGSGKNRLHTLNYYFAFRDQKLSALARYLGLNHPTMAKTALALANLVYSSIGPDSRDESFTPQVSVGKNKYDMILEGGNLSIPEAVLPDEVRPRRDIHFQLDREEIPHVGTAIPLNVHTSSSRLIINMHRRHDRSDALMPLPPDLLPLWEGAKFLAMADPDDGGYLAKIM